MLNLVKKKIFSLKQEIKSKKEEKVVILIIYLFLN